MMMDSKTGGQFEVPQEMRAFAEKSFEQARKAFETFISTARHTVSVLEDQAETTRQGARDLGQRAASFAETNIANSFDFAQRLVRARDVNEMVKIQSDYVASQMKVLSDQAKELGESTAKFAKDTAAPKR
jgi:phasin